MVICSVCYEDVKPESEFLQAVDTCGHVFHELCLQQWLEICKNPSCPMCKRSCSKNRVQRLYFSTTSDEDCTQRREPKNQDCQDAKELQGRIQKLEAQLSVATMGVQNYQQQLKELDSSAARNKALLNDAVSERDSNKILAVKLQQELEKCRADRARLLDKNASLARELASVKLCTEVNLNQEEVVRLSSMGQVHDKDSVIDTLSRSLVYRQEAYRSLSIQLSALAEREYRSLQKAEQASQQLKKVRTRMLEMERAAEVKENSNLRSLRAQTVEHKENNSSSKEKAAPPTRLSLDEEETIQVVIRQEASGLDGDNTLPASGGDDIQARKRAYANTPAPTSFSSKGSFISSGADGRGGRVTVLKPPQPSGLVKNASTSRQHKRQKLNQPSKGSGVQIDHFFGRRE